METRTYLGGLAEIPRIPLSDADTGHPEYAAAV
jgi:hypothetical protein